jgi:hypothetical protein
MERSAGLGIYGSAVTRREDHLDVFASQYGSIEIAVDRRRFDEEK